MWLPLLALLSPAWALRHPSLAQHPHVGLIFCKMPEVPAGCDYSEDGPAEAPTSMGVVVSTFEENLAWLSEVDIGNVTVYVHDRSQKRTHVGETSDDNLRKALKSQKLLEEGNAQRRWPISFVDIPNVGDEGAAFLKHIVEHYDELPEILFFVHGHRCSNHANADMVRHLLIQQQCFKADMGYATLNNPNMNQHVCPDTTDKKWVKEKRIVKIREPWPELLEGEFGGFPQKFCFDSYAQFAVSRERIRAHPKAFYEGLRAGVLAGKTTMEWYWRTLFVPQFL